MTVFLFGLDGASLENLAYAMECADLPNFKKILNLGASRRLKSVYPYVTAPAWTSLFSGVNPGKHGIFDMINNTDGASRPSNMAECDVPFLWDYLSWAGKRILAVGIPFIYPAPQVNGIFLTGRFVPELSCRPKELQDKFDLSGYRYEMPTLGREWVMINNLGLEEVMNPKIENLRRRIQNSTALLKSDKWDAVIIVDDLPDAVFHHAYHDRSIVRRTFELFDEWLGVILQEFKSGDSLFVVSDHGFSEVLGKLFINEWLIEKGYLRPKKSYSFKSVKKFGRSQLDAVRRLGHSMSRTDLTIKARPKKNSSLLDVDERSIFSVGYVHDEVAWLKLREDLNADGESNIDRVIQDLEQLKQRAVVKNVFKVSEIYHGKHLSKAPGQVLLEAVDGWQISKSRHPQRRLSGKPNSMKKGTHRLEGMLICLGVDLTESPPCLYDIVPTVLDLLRLPIPDYLDGQSLIVKNSTGSRSWSLDTKLNDHSNNSNLV